jgi:hypothetical protein
MSRWMTISLSKPRMVDIIGLRRTVLNFAGCVSPLDARKRIALLARAPKTGLIS